MKEPRRRHYLLFEPRNKIRLSISRTLSKKGLSFLEGRYPWSMPELHMKFPGRKRNERVGCRKRSTRELNECRELTVCTTALRIGWSTHIAWYCATLQNSRSWWSQHLHFRVALWKGWGSIDLCQHCNKRVWIMHARKVVSIVFCCEVWDLLQNVCLCNGSFNFTFIFAFCSKNPFDISQLNRNCNIL